MFEIFKSALPTTKQRRRILDGPAAGCHVQLSLRSQFRILFGVYGRELLPHYRSLMRPGMKSFDIRGRDGYRGLLISSITKATVISIECEAAGIVEMNATIAAKVLPIEAVNAFVGAKVSADSTTIDAIAKTRFLPDFIKIDIEGGEAEALAGATQVLAERRPSLIIEVHSVEQEELCIRTLQEYGYLVRTVDQARYFRETRPC